MRLLGAIYMIVIVAFISMKTTAWMSVYGLTGGSIDGNYTNRVLTLTTPSGPLTNVATSATTPKFAAVPTCSNGQVLTKSGVGMACVDASAAGSSITKAEADPAEAEKTIEGATSEDTAIRIGGEKSGMKIWANENGVQQKVYGETAPAKVATPVLDSPVNHMLEAQRHAMEELMPKIILILIVGAGLMVMFGGNPFSGWSTPLPPASAFHTTVPPPPPPQEPTQVVLPLASDSEPSRRILLLPERPEEPDSEEVKPM